MKTATNTICQGNHDHNGKRDAGRFDVYTWDGAHYTVCAHLVRGSEHCGALINISAAGAVICCGNH